MRKVMAEQLHPAAAHHLPMFITAPGETDVLMVVTAVILGLAVFGFGVLFLRLHTLPERVAHKAHKIQFEIVAILGLQLSQTGSCAPCAQPARAAYASAGRGRRNRRRRDQE